MSTIDLLRSEKIQAVSDYDPYRAALEEELREVFSSRDGFLYDVLRYHLGWTDQRGNPENNPQPLHFPSMLALLSCQALSDDFRPALPAAAGIELVHNFTLVHGDVQSGRAEAGDRPSIWWVWGPAQAINAGDGLHALGRTTMMRLVQRGVPVDRVLQAVQSLDQACLTLCEGQFMDLDFQDQMMVTSAAYYDMVSRKTGALTGCAAESGALAAGSDDALCDTFRDMGRLLGMAWQVSQDIADLWGRRQDGMTASNVLNKKKSLPLIHALENASVATKRELGGVYMKRVLQKEDVAQIIGILDQAGSQQFARDKAKELVDQALEVVNGAGVSDDGMDGLRRLSRLALESGTEIPS